MTKYIMQDKNHKDYKHWQSHQQNTAWEFPTSFTQSA